MVSRVVAVAMVVGSAVPVGAEAVADDRPPVIAAQCAEQGITGHALKDINHVISLLDQESSLVTGIDTAAAPAVSHVNGQINQVQSQILNIVNHDATLAALARKQFDRRKMGSRKGHNGRGSHSAAHRSVCTTFKRTQLPALCAFRRLRLDIFLQASGPGVISGLILAGRMRIRNQVHPRPAREARGPG